MRGSSPLWLDVVKHRIRRLRSPYLLVLQHHDIPAVSRLVVTVVPPDLRGDDVLSPRIDVGGQEYRARMLEINAVPRAALGETVASAAEYADIITNALDIILCGYVVGRPH